MKELVVDHKVHFRPGDSVSWYSRRWKTQRFGRVVDIREHGPELHPDLYRVVIEPCTKRNKSETRPAILKYKCNLWTIPSLEIQ